MKAQYHLDSFDTFYWVKEGGGEATIAKRGANLVLGGRNNLTVINSRLCV